MTIDIIRLSGLIFISYSNFVLIGYLKDISADKATGYQTFPVKFGWIKTIWLGDLILTLSALVYFATIQTSQLGLLIGIAALIIGITGQLKAHLVKEKTEQNATYPIVCTVRCIILWLLGVAVSYNTQLLTFAICFYLLFELIMYLRPMKEQI